MRGSAASTIDDRLTTEAFIAFAQARPREERWQLIDGEAVMMMSPATGKYQKIAANLDRQLTAGLEGIGSQLDVLREIGLAVEGRPDFRPIVDLAIVPSEVGDTLYFAEFYLAAEILSPSNTHGHISRKRQYYAESPKCLHVLILAQDDICLELWSRSEDWRGRVYRSADDVITLPEFGVSCRLGDLYKGTPIR